MNDDPTSRGRPRAVRSDGPVIVPPSGSADSDVLLEEERTSVLPNGSVVHDSARVEQRSTGRGRLPWILIALLLAILVTGAAVWFLSRASTKPVPAVLGLRIDNAVTRLQGDGFKVQISRQSSAKPPAIVIGQNPAAATKADSGSTVHLVASRGPSSSTVLNAVGLPQSDARSKLVQAGFAVTTAQVFSDQPTGTVVAQDPAAGEHVSPGAKVRLNVSKGSGGADVPNEVGNSMDQAQSDLVAQGFKPAVTRVASDQPIDTVVAQSPSGGKARKGATVRLNVSEGPQTATTIETTTTTVPASTTGTTTTP